MHLKKICCTILSNYQTLEVSILGREGIESAITELATLIYNDIEDELFFQGWFEKYPIIFNILGFISHIPHPIIKTSNGDKYIPDFIVQKPNGAWEIFELKTPSCKILRRRDRRETFYAIFNEYCAQCIEYSQAFDDEQTRDLFCHEYDLDFINKRPNSTIIAGAGESLDPPRLVSISSRFTPQITVYSYEDILFALINYRATNFGSYDAASGFGLHAALILHKPPQRSKNYIVDIGIKENSDRISIFIDKKHYIRIKLWDSDGHIHNAKSLRPIDISEYESEHWLLCEAGVFGNFGFVTIQFDGIYLADIRIENFPMNIESGSVVGSDWSASECSWFSLRDMAILSRAFSFEEKMLLRRQAKNSGTRFPEELLKLPWDGVYGCSGEYVMEFKGHKWMGTAGHPALSNKQLIK